MMNIVYANVSESLQGQWAMPPESFFLYQCDGSPMFPAYRVLYSGIGTVNLGNPVAGAYRLMIRCGRNARVDDLNDCKNLNVYFDTSALNATNGTTSQ